MIGLRKINFANHRVGKIISTIIQFAVPTFIVWATWSLVPMPHSNELKFSVVCVAVAVFCFSLWLSSICAYYRMSYSRSSLGHWFDVSENLRWTTGFIGIACCALGALVTVIHFLTSH